MLLGVSFDPIYRSMTVVTQHAHICFYMWLPVGDLEEEELMPVDVDLNLVQNLLASYEAQEGLAGPVGNLAGMLGLQIPDRQS